MDMATQLNVRAEIFISRELPGTGKLEASATIWWAGSRFHVRVESGLPAGDLLALASSPRGFGREPRTKEEFMDTRTNLSGVIEVYGDSTARRGTVVKGGTRLDTDTELLLPLAELVLSGEVADLKPTGHDRLLDRDVTEYTTYLSAEDDARSKVRRLVSGPYTLLRDVTDERRSGARLRVEVRRLDEGVVKDADVQSAAVSSGG
jgi:hypothetical protein